MQNLTINCFSLSREIFKWCFSKTYLNDVPKNKNKLQLNDAFTATENFNLYELHTWQQTQRKPKIRFFIHMSSDQNPFDMPFYCTDWLIEILILAYYNPL